VSRLTTYDRQGLVFDVRDDGPEDGDPVVLLHGFPERSTSWRAVAPLLHAQGLRTYAPDQRGYSPGARPTGRWHYRVPDLVDDVVALIDRIGRPVHLVGHDWGSNVGWYVAGRHPELVRTWTAVSVPHPAAFVGSMRHRSQWRKSWYIAAFQLPFAPEWQAQRGLMAKQMRRAGMTPEEVERFQTEMVEDGALPGGLGWYRALPLTSPSYGAGRVRVPTTLVWSDRDVAISRLGVDATPPYVDAPYRLVVLEGVSHWVPTQAPGALAEAVLDRIGSV
jgi:pimeloyl-ACP methyl ester carboxylesterase